MAGELTITTGPKARALVSYLATRTQVLRVDIEQKSSELSSKERDLEIIKQKVAELAVGAPMSKSEVAINESTSGLGPLIARYKDEVESWVSSLPNDQKALFIGGNPAPEQP